MKKLIIAILLAAVCIAFGWYSSMCFGNNANKVQSIMTKEWVSPDGVHYWGCYYGFDRFGLAPRYDGEGKLVIDDE